MVKEKKFTFLVDVSTSAYEAIHSICGYKGKNLNPSRMGSFLEEEEEKEEFLALFHNKLKNSLSTIKPVCEDIILVFDCLSGTPKRFEMYPDYKGGRDKNKIAFNKKEFSKCVERYFSLMAEAGVRVVEVSKLEADDVIYWLKELLKGDQKNSCVVTRDSDLRQVVETANGSYHILFDLNLGVALTDQQYDVDENKDFFDSSTTSMDVTMDRIFSDGVENSTTTMPKWLENKKTINPAEVLLGKVVVGDASDAIPSAIKYKKGNSIMGVSKDRMKKLFEAKTLKVNDINFTWESIGEKLIFELNESIKTKKNPNVVVVNDENRDRFNFNLSLIKLDGSILSDEEKEQINRAYLAGSQTNWRNFFDEKMFEQGAKSWFDIGRK